MDKGPKFKNRIEYGLLPLKTDIIKNMDYYHQTINQHNKQQNKTHSIFRLGSIYVHSYTHSNIIHQTPYHIYQNQATKSNSSLQTCHTFKSNKNPYDFFIKERKTQENLRVLTSNW